MSILLSLLGFLLASTFVQAREINLQHAKHNAQFDFKVESDSGEQYDLKLTKADQSVLHPDIQIISIGIDKESGRPFYESWAPSKEELRASEMVYVDEKNLAAVRVNYENGKHSMVGVVNGMRLDDTSGKPKLYSQVEQQNRSDYIDIGRTLTMNQENQNATVDAIVEVVIVCDKEFGDVFEHDRNKILDYLTVYFWDVNLRFKTLPSSNISFRVTGVVILAAPSAQPFIEEARASDGRAELGRILGGFSFRVYEQLNVLPKFDMAIAITNTRLEWWGGIAYVRTACNLSHGQKRHWGTLVVADSGEWNSVTIGAHEIGHSLGAPHDHDPNYPGGCDASGYIMEENQDLQWFFSTCSDRTIGGFVRSDQGACLRTIDHSGGLPISPDFSFILAPNKEEQCRKRFKNPQIYITSCTSMEEPRSFCSRDLAECRSLKCWVPREGGWTIYSLSPLDNSPCGDGKRCFRGRCRKLGSLIRNVGSGQCLRATNAFAFNSSVDLVNCPQPGTALDRFAISDENIGRTLSTPWSTIDGKENDDKCLYTVGTTDGSLLTTDRCNPLNSSQGWDFIDVGNGEFLMSHRLSGRCAKVVGTEARTYENCDRNDPAMRWKFL